MEKSDHEVSGVTVCKNCENTFAGNFCNSCGQSADTHPINFHFLWHDIQHSFLHIEKGVFYTLKELYIRPGDTIRGFLAGKRVNHFKPLALVLLLGGIYGFLYIYLDINAVPVFVDQPDASKSALYLNKLLGEHYALAEILFIPFFAAGTYLVFRRSGYNYVQNIVINLFLAAQRLVISFILLPFIYLFQSTHNAGLVNSLTILIGVALYMWSLAQFYNRPSKIKTALKALWAFMLGYILLLVLGMIGGVVYAILEK